MIELGRSEEVILEMDRLASEALSTLHRLKKTEDNAHYENWSQSSSSWWQWQTTWWHPYYETSPQRWTQH